MCRVDGDVNSAIRWVDIGQSDENDFIFSTQRKRADDQKNTGFNVHQTFNFVARTR